MGISARLLAGLAGATLLMTSLTAPAEVIFEDNKVLVRELRFKPGDMGPDVVRPEERHLAERFGAAYDAYRQRTRRWL